MRFHGFKIPVLEVEQAILELPMVSEACIVSVQDKDASTRVAALVRCREGLTGVNLATIRESLAPKLLHYKLPTALRLLTDAEQMPLAVSGKVLRKRVVEQFFPITGHCQLPADVEVWDINDKKLNGGSRRAWDWAGLQGC